MVRRLLDDFRDYPATMTLCSLWVIVFALMVGNQMTRGHMPSVGELALAIHGGHPFGELTIQELFQGEIWRPLTATFVHYGLLHLGMNLYIMYQLGPVVETWYGPWQFVAVYVATGYGGNLLSALVRHVQGSNPTAASGGGSTVILGLVGLCAVVGWRSRTRIGAFLSSQMVGLLVATALIGRMIPIIDNWGHAGGALIGAAIGFAHRTLIRTAQSPVAKWAGSVSALLLILSGAAQLHDDRAESSARVAAEARSKAAAQAIRTLQGLFQFYDLAWRRSVFEHMTRVDERVRHADSKTLARDGLGPPSLVKPLSLLDSSDGEFRTEQRRQLGLFDSCRRELETGSTTTDFRRLKTLLGRVLSWPPSQRDMREFGYHHGVLLRSAMADQDRVRGELQSLQQQGHAGSDRALNRERRDRWRAWRPRDGGDAPASAAAPQ
jgi:rhomboid protease GluP